MVKQLILTIFSLLFSLQVFAAPPRYLAYVDGLACPFCVYGIEKQLRQLDGVETIESDIKTGELRIQMREHKSLTEEQVRAAIKSSGFSLRSFSQLEVEQEP